ncbi:SusC/RagA family TonB-linked outer membrane protein [Deminuibacter soli]|uniref:TonB-dependent receptor n=1 Tax=Deminuibacter soli TaxID=2291815 RepID=A0A3E1NK43_9BACT|nr:TonB-dependent receptor [Deminuibacter soli]RFM28194.1 TonB-dependent receptor [Deminuibacter soli]
MQLPKRLKSVLLLHALLLACHFLHAQSTGIPVRGRVTDSKDSALSNVSIIVKGTSKGTTSDASGNFKLNVPNSSSVLLVTFVGYKDQELPVGSNTSFHIQLTPSAGQLEQIVVVGYGTQKKVTVTGAVVSVKGAELEKSPTVNLSNSLAGRLPGITAVQASGEPGYDGSTIRIRGTNTLGNTSALVVIDGVPDRPGGMERLNPADIESMSVLKDASAAIYGARAANGVILITTKHGKNGKPSLSYDYNQGWAQPTRIPKVANATQYAEMNNELVMYDNVNAGEWETAWPQLVKSGSYTKSDGVVVNAPYSPDDMKKYADGSDPWGHPNTDWFKTTLKNWSPQSRHNLQVNGGSDNVRYLASLGYTNQDGYYKNSATGYKQYDFRLNLDVKVNKYINVSLGASGREEYRFYPTETAGSIFRMMMRGKPTEQEVWPNGLPGPDIENGQNPIVITTNQTGYDKDKRDYLLSNGKVEIQIPGVPGLKLTGTASIDKEIQRVKDWQTPWYLYFWDKISYEADGKTPLLTKSVRSTYSDPRLTQSDDNFLNILLSGFLNYDKTIGSHTINLMAAVTKEKDNEDNFNGYRRYFISTAVDQLFAGGDPEKNASGGAYERARLSYFGRAAYNYKEKYLAEFLWRYDGSYLFPEKSRFGFFPGVLAGWRISEENFFKNNVRWMNNLKLRASWGQMGNDQVYFNGVLQEYQYLGTYPFGSYVVDNNVARTLAYTRVPNPDFTWEVANNSDIGIEGSLLDSRLSFEFDYFINKRNKILIQKQGSTPASSGIANLLPPVNMGRLQNKGYEFKVSYAGDIGRDFRYNVSVNGGYAKNKILYWDEAPGAPEWQKSTNHPFGSNGRTYLAYQYDGVFTDVKDIAASKLDYSALSSDLKPGDMKFKDINGDGKIDANDQVALDKTRDPTFTGGVNINLSYKGFDATILFQGATGGLLYFGTESGDIGNYLKYSYDHQWTVDNHSSVDPRIANRGNTYYTGGAAALNTYFLRNSDYLRLKNLELGYTVPAGLLKKAGINNLRVYVSGLNLITWDKMKIYDPESTSSNGQYYPQSRIWSVGGRITF